MKLDTLFFSAHPDDVELSCSGTILKLIKEGKKVGVVDLTRGELSTRGNPEIRAKETKEASEILSLSVRENLRLEDGYFEINDKSVKSVIKVIRKYQPKTIFSNAIRDRHPDHGRGAELLKKAVFLSGLTKIELKDDHGKELTSWRPAQHFHYIQNDYIEPDFVIDISEHWEDRMKSVYAYASQFFNSNSREPETHISSERFIKFIEARAREMGNKIGVEFGEGFTSDRVIGLSQLRDLI